MKKFSTLNEGKIFMVDPSIIKKYASFIIPLYITGELSCDYKLIDEWLENNKNANKSKGSNYLLDIEIFAVKNIISNPLSQNGYEELIKEINAKCPKLERFMKPFITEHKKFK